MSRSGPLVQSKGVADLRFDDSATDEIELDEETLAELARRSARAKTGRSIPLEEVRKLILKWISEFASRRPRCCRDRQLRFADTTARSRSRLGSEPRR